MSDSKSIGLEAFSIASYLGMSLANLVISAILKNDVETMKKVSDLFPDGAVILSRLALISAEENARKKLE